METYSMECAFRHAKSICLTRSDLSFVRSDPLSGEVFEHWNVRHDPQELYAQKFADGERMFQEVRALARADQAEAVRGVVLAMCSKNWKPGYGCEDGFMTAAARAALGEARSSAS